MTIQVDLDVLESEIRALARQFPDRVVECRYVNEDGIEPLCIIGTALFNIGVPLRAMVGYDELGGTTCWSIVEGVEHDSWIATVQLNQDKKLSWGLAVDYTDEEFGLDNPAEQD